LEDCHVFPKSSSSGQTVPLVATTVAYDPHCLASITGRAGAAAQITILIHSN
jgi:hypothetical protein